MCTFDGAGLVFEPYCGRSTNIEDRGLGQGPNIVLDLAEKAQLAPGEKICCDNLFTSSPLLTEMSKKGFGITGTVRQNRLNKVPIIKKEAMEKKTIARGTVESVYISDQVVTCWKDNKPVYAMSNKWNAETPTNCTRFNRTERKKVDIPIPTLIQKYNQGMGGVDLLDNMVACYRIPFR